MRTPPYISAIALLCSATVASAQHSSAEAETLFRQARELMAQKKYTEACAAFESSQKLDPSPTTVYSLGVCRELEGKLASAWGTLIDFERQQRSSTEPGVIELRKKATDRAKALEPRLSKLTIVVAPERVAPDLVTQRDGIDLDRGIWGRPLPIDGGPHTVTAKRPGFKDWSITVTTKSEGDSQTVTIPVLVAAPTKAAASEPTPPRPVPKRLEPRSKVVPIAFASGALVLGGAAIGFELWGSSMHDKAQTTLDAGDGARASDLQDGANLRRYLAQGMGVAAIGCAVVSVILFVRGGGEESSGAQTPKLTVTPAVNPGSLGVQLSGGW